MKMRYTDITGAILAGGRNSRMGHHKAFITLRSGRIIDIIIGAMNNFFDEIMIVTSDKGIFSEYKDVEIVEDLIRERGPLGGIYTGLNFSRIEKAFFIACDMPFLHNGLISKLLKTSTEGNFDCVIPYTDRGIEPLCAIYSKKILPELKESLNEKDLSIRHFLEHCNCKYIEAKPEEGLSFFNINTPKDLKKVKLYEDKIKNLA